MSNFIILECKTDKTLHFLKESKVISHDDEDIAIGKMVTFNNNGKFDAGEVLNFSGKSFGA